MRRIEKHIEFFFSIFFLLLQSLLICLRESHRTRTVFRKVGGFVYVMSVLVSMEGCLCEEPAPPWDEIPVSQVLNLLHMVFNTVTVAMRFEPANAKFFHLEVSVVSCMKWNHTQLKTQLMFSDKIFHHVLFNFYNLNTFVLILNVLYVHLSSGRPRCAWSRVLEKMIIIWLYPSYSVHTSRSVSCYLCGSWCVARSASQASVTL